MDRNQNGPPESSPGPDNTHAGWFAATHWSVVLAAGKTDSARRAEALEQLCHAYWEPIYAFVRHLGHEVHDAQDLTQAFFAHLLTGNRLASASPEKGKFRSFLLASLKNFLADQHDRAQAEKRGGGQAAVPLDAELAESHYAQDISSSSTAEMLFDRRWAMTLLNQALVRLEKEHAVSGKSQQFAELKGFLSVEGNAAQYEAAAGRLRTTAGAVSVAVHRLRVRYRELIRAEIAETVAGPREVEEEMHYLLELLCQG
jgi:RNA polymerase sigma factor (sigma-70 family)